MHPTDVAPNRAYRFVDANSCRFFTREGQLRSCAGLAQSNASIILLPEPLSAAARVLVPDP